MLARLPHDLEVVPFARHEEVGERIWYERLGGVLVYRTDNSMQNDQGCHVPDAIAVIIDAPEAP